VEPKLQPRAAWAKRISRGKIRELKATQNTRPRNGNYKHGRYTAETIATRQWLREQIREVRALTKRLRQL
jgi:hypothetical protein